MRNVTKQRVVVVFVVVVVVADVLTFTHRHNTMQSAVAGQAPITRGWKNTSYVCRQSM